MHQDEVCIAFLDLFPVQPGHLLVVPRRHVTDLLDCPPDTAAHLFRVCAALAPAAVRATEAEGFNVWVANGKAAGQDVFHLHLHLLPRRAGDAFGLRFPRGYPREALRPELDAMARRIRAVSSGRGPEPG